jgi:hypothetical protein
MELYKDVRNRVFGFWLLTGFDLLVKVARSDGLQGGEQVAYCVMVQREHSLY